jgi:parallel beta-helix repeat protein
VPLVYALILIGVGLHATKAHADTGHLINVAFGKPVTVSDPNAILNGANPSIITDGDTARAHYVLVSVQNGAQYVQVDLRQPYDVAKVTIWNDYNPDRPRREQDVIIQLSNDPTFSKGVTTIFNNDQDNSAGQGAGHDQEYVNPTDGSGKTVVVDSPVSARYARVWTNGQHYVDDGSYAPVDTPVEVAVYANPHDSAPPATVQNLHVDRKATRTVRLSWKAPGDDGYTGKVRSYDFRYSTSPISAANFDKATKVLNEPTPQAGGTTQTLTLGFLTPGATYYFALKAEDDALNQSGLSNVASAALAKSDAVAPAAVRNLVASHPNIHSVQLNWTAPGNDGNFGRAVSYDLRYSTSPITTANWNAARRVETFYERPAGEPMANQVNQLATNRTYYFAVRTKDASGNVSGLSNVVRATTYTPTPDRVTVTSLAGLRAAIDSAPASGRVITLAAGVYHQTSGISIVDKNNITIQGATSDYKDTVIVGPGINDKSLEENIRLKTADYITIKNLTLKDTDYHGIKINKGSDYFTADHIKTWDNGESGFKVTGWTYTPWLAGNDYGLIENCLIGFTTTGQRSVIEGIDIVGSKGWVIRGNTIKNVRKAPGQTNPAYGAFAKGNSIGTIIEDNLFINDDIGPSFGGGGTGLPFFRNGDIQWEHRGGIIRNNIIYGSTDSSIYIKRANNFKVYNNTVIRPSQGLLAIQSNDYVGWLKRGKGLARYGSLRFLEGKVRLLPWEKEFLTTGDSKLLDAWGDDHVPYSSSNGNIYSNLMNGQIQMNYRATATMENNILDAPNDSFVNPSAGNYHLKRTASVAIDQVKLFSQSVRFDFDGQPRPYGAGWDIGADEYVAPLADIPHLDESLVYAGRQGKITNNGILNSLVKTARHIQSQKTNRGIVNGLNTLKHKVQAQSGKHIDQAFADRLLAAIAKLKAQYSH